MGETPYVCKFGKSGYILLRSLSRSKSGFESPPCYFFPKQALLFQQCGYLAGFPGILWFGDCLENYCCRLMSFIYHFTYLEEEAEPFMLSYSSFTYIDWIVYMQKWCYLVHCSLSYSQEKLKQTLFKIPIYFHCIFDFSYKLQAQDGVDIFRMCSEYQCLKSLF